MAARACDPRVRVAAVLPKGDGIILVRHRRGEHEYHLLPGGGVEAGETLADALVREVREETGIQCEVVHPLFINDSIDPNGSRHVIQITFLARSLQEPAAGLTSTDPRVVGIEVVAVDTLRDVDLRPPMARELATAAGSDYQAPTAYLGPLWVDESGITGAGVSERTDG